MMRFGSDAPSALRVGKDSVASLFVFAKGGAVRIWEAVSNCIAGGWWQRGHGWQRGCGWGERRR